MEEREAFREFYLKYAKKLYRVVERLQEIQEGKVGDITEDVVQELFLNIWKNRERIEIKENVGRKN